jgi:ankyrin repeat protein
VIDEAALRAIADGDPAGLRESVTSGIDLDAQDSRRGYTLLHVAAQQVDVEAVRLLLRSGANPNVTDAYGNGPLWTAVFNDRDGQILDLLQQAGANPAHVNGAGETPISLSWKIGGVAADRLAGSDGKT